MDNNIYGSPKTVTKNLEVVEIEITQRMIDSLSRGGKWAIMLSLLSISYMSFVLFQHIKRAFSYYEQMYFYELIIGGAVTLFSAIALYITYRVSKILFLYGKSVLKLRNTQDFNDLLASQTLFRLFVKWIAIINISTTIILIFISVAYEFIQSN